MNKQIATRPPPSDGFDDIGSGTGSLIKGAKLKFTNGGAWLSDDGEVIEAGREFLVIHLVRGTQKWINNRPVETIVHQPCDAFPDVTAMNEAAPRSEWRDAFGKSVGPWQNVWIAYLLDPVTLEAFTFPTSTQGGFRALQDLKESTARARLTWERSVYPVVRLADVPMRTAYGARQRPHFKIIDYKPLGTGALSLAGPSADFTHEPD